MTDTEVGLVRVVVVTPRRHLDLALPGQLTLAMLLPAVLSHAGDEATHQAGEQGGWLLRRTDGTPLDVGRGLTAQGVRDGDVLHLVHAQVDWPEPEYDDVVEVIAASARQGGLVWSTGVSRWTGTVAMGVLVAAALAVCLRTAVQSETAAQSSIGAWWGLGLAIGCLTGGILLTRAYDEPDIGRTVAGYGLVAAFVGGLLVLPRTGPGPELAAPHLLTGFALLLLAGTVGYLGSSGRRWLFVAAMVAGVAGAGGALVALSPLDLPSTAAVTVSVLLLLTPTWPAIAGRLGRLPLPAFPRSTSELLQDAPPTPAAVTFGVIAQADDMLTGLLAGATAVIAPGLVALGLADGLAAPVLGGVVTAACLLRARLFPAVRHRLPMLLAGLTGLVALSLRLPVEDPPGWSLLALVGSATVVLALGLRRNRSSVYLGRAAELLDILLLLAVVPLVCGVLGLYAVMRGLAG
ncbi:type VII secretion integral membrane protein EccD [Micromonospora polyrhachis]|uniref:Type VII secretion integral membrane protein EccD n=1 Tax=Micromonospora polyrhachis TaxID=1282883 RepID=A0A7W7STF1_9ACTN|nr:type VII secretion integral membrane protein EccD [Micromonospora polyrhachis]MBB4960236.1 type VII secretion integral membrane protein EccD [Micromonospora polyrhachis]